jgi:hypothetical protein
MRRSVGYWMPKGAGRLRAGAERGGDNRSDDRPADGEVAESATCENPAASKDIYMLVVVIAENEC